MLTVAFKDAGWSTGPAVDIALGDEFDVWNHFFMAALISIILEGRILLLHLGPPCASLSMAVNRLAKHMMRCEEFPAGLPDLQEEKKRHKVQDGNALA